MGSRILVVPAGIALAIGVALLGHQAVGIRAKLKAVAAAGRLDAARSSGGAKDIEKAARELAGFRPRDASLQLIRGRALLAAGEFEKAARVYSRAAKRTSGRPRAVAEIGHGCALLRRGARPSPEALKAATDAFKRAVKADGKFRDAFAMLAVAHAWAGDLDAAGAAAERATGTLGLEPTVALACARAFIAASTGDGAAATEEIDRARAVDPKFKTSLGKYLQSLGKGHKLKAAALPGANKKLRDWLVAHLKSAGKKGIANAATYPMFLRAAFAAATTGSKQVGMPLLDLAVKNCPDDPAPRLYRAAALAEGLAASWEAAEKEAKSARVKPGWTPARPRAGLPTLVTHRGASSARARPNAKLAKLEKAGARLLQDVARAAKLLAAGQLPSGEARLKHPLALFEYIFRWKLQAAYLSTIPDARRKRLLAAAEIANEAERCLGPHMSGADAARLMRNAGTIRARYAEWREAFKLWDRSLALDPAQPNLVALLERARKGPAVAAVHPASPGTGGDASPLLGAEFTLPSWLTDLSAYKVTATVGPKGGPGTEVTPTVSGTGLWLIPSENTEGPLEARFEVTDPFGAKVTAGAALSVDASPPEVTSRSPAPGVVSTERPPLLRRAWKDASGLDPASVEVIVEPVRAAFMRQIVVTGGQQRVGRYAGKVTWKSRAPVVPVGFHDSGAIATGTASPMPTGVFRVRVQLKDAGGRRTEDAWTFTIE